MHESLATSAVMLQTQKLKPCHFCSVTVAADLYKCKLASVRVLWITACMLSLCDQIVKGLNEAARSLLRINPYSVLVQCNIVSRQNQVLMIYNVAQQYPKQAAFEL